jgi:alpha-beta hydrolase superfamily lysophospholipase
LTTKILPVPDSVSNFTDFKWEFVSTKDGRQIFQRTARLQEPVRAEVVLTHGLGEHSERYGHVAQAFAARGLRLHAYDIYGHGRSPGVRGDAPNYDVFLDDLGCVLAELPAEGRPLFLMGHSFGAQITLNYLARRECACRGAVIASPWLRLAFRPPLWRVALATLMMRFWPTFRQRTPHDVHRLSRDLDHVAELPGAELMHHRLSARLYFALVQGGRAALAAASKITLPFFLLHGGDDPVTSGAASTEFFEKAAATDKTFTIYPQARHETHNDLCRDQVIKDMVAWIEARI